MSKQMKRTGYYALPFLMVGATVIGVRYYAQAQGGVGEQVAWSGGSSQEAEEPPQTWAIQAQPEEFYQPLYIEPIEGLTTRRHQAPPQTAISLGLVLRFAQKVPRGGTVTWTGAREVERQGRVSIAECPLTEVGSQTIVATVEGQFRYDNQILLKVVDVPIEQISVSPIAPSVEPVDLDENSTNEETLHYFFDFPSIAKLRQVGQEQYRTSVEREVLMVVEVDPPGFAPLIEWQIDGGEPFLGGDSPAQSFDDVGVHTISVGPPARRQGIEIETYSVTITSHQSWHDIVAEGEPITFEAVTDPPGYEDEIAWLSSTLYGTAAPVLGQGPTFTAQFDGTWGWSPTKGIFQWLGVRADNVAFNQDQKRQDPPPCGCKEATPAAPCDCKGGGCGGDTTYGDPVYLFSGEFVESVVDLRIKGRGIDFVWARKYRSQFGLDTAQGNRWDFSYNISLQPSGDSFILDEGNARKDAYLPQPDETWSTPEFFRVLTQEEDGSHTLTFPDTGTWHFHPFDGSQSEGKISRIVDRNGNTISLDYDDQGRLVTIHDPLDTDEHNRDITIAYNEDGFIESVTDFIGRQVRYEYYQDGDEGGSFGDLKSVRSPIVEGTPNGNDFPEGKTTLYTYSTGFGNDQLNHNLLTITDPKVQIYLTNTYGDSGSGFNRVIRQVWGDPGDIIDFVYVPVAPSEENNFAVAKVIVNDRVGNVEESFIDEDHRTVMFKEFTGRADPDQPTTENVNRPMNPLRDDDPPSFNTEWDYNDDSLLLETTFPNGNMETFVYDESNDSRRSRGNLLTHCFLPGPLGGDQEMRCESFEYDDGFGGCCGTNFVTRYTDFRGNDTEHEYDDFGNRTHSEHRIPSIVEDFEYNEFGQMTESTLPDNGSNHRRIDEYHYYDSGPQRGYLQHEIIDSVFFALRTTYEHDRVGNVNRKTDPRGHDTQYVYNQLDQVVRVRSRGVELPANVPVRYERDTFYDANDNVVRVDIQNIGDAGVLQDNTHFTTVYEYDILNYQTRMCEEVGDFIGDIPGETNLPTCPPQPDADFITTEYEYDANRNRTLMRYGEATNGNQPTNTMHYEYDERDLLFKAIRAKTDPDQSTNQYDYDPNLNRKRTSQGLEDAPRITTNTYDGYDRMVQSIDPMGNVKDYHYDPNGNFGGDREPGEPSPFGMRVSGELIDVEGSAGNVPLSQMTYEYDPMDRVTREEIEFFDTDTQAPIQIPGVPTPGKVTTATQWNDNSQVLQVTNDNNHSTTTEYDTANRVSVVTDAKGNTVTYGYDANSNVRRATQVEKSDLGNADETFVTTDEYDNLDRLISTTDNVGNTNRFGYDSRDNQTVMIDALDHETRYVYDGINRLIKTVRDLNDDGADINAEPGDENPDIVTTQDFDDTSRLSKQTDDSNNTTEYVFDPLHRMTAKVMADCTEHTYTFDVHDNPLTMTDANGSEAESTDPSDYDLLNRLIDKKIQRAPGVMGTTFEIYKYDGLSRIVHAEDDDSLVTRRHDSLSRVTSELLIIARGEPNETSGTTVCLYDGVGNELESTYPGGRFITCAYDDLERKELIEDKTAAPMTIATYAYVGPGRVTRREYVNGTRTDYTYDGITGIPNEPDDFGVRMIVGTRHVFDSGGPNETVIDDRTYTWDRMYNKTQRKDVRPGDPEFRFKHAYEYDDIYRLTHTTVTDLDNVVVRDTDYSLDGVSNRTKVNGEPDPGQYTMVGDMCNAPADQDMNQYTTTPLDSREYDENGNLIRRTATGDPPPMGEVTYDYRNQMVEFNDMVAGQRHTYAYDALGRRIARVVDADGAGGGPTETRYFYDAWKVGEEQDGASATEATYVYGLYIDEVLNMQRGDKDFFYHTDDLYNIMAVTDDTGAVTDDGKERYEYADYGQPVDPNDVTMSIDPPDDPSAIGNPYLFTGRRYDPETGWYYYRTRYLDSVAGRFTTRDTIGIWRDSANHGNGYAYVGNGPASTLDPYGKGLLTDCKKGEKQTQYWDTPKHCNSGTKDDEYEWGQEASVTVTVEATDGVFTTTIQTSLKQSLKITVIIPPGKCAFIRYLTICECKATFWCWSLFNRYWDCKFDRTVSMQVDP